MNKTKTKTKKRTKKNGAEAEIAPFVSRPYSTPESECMAALLGGQRWEGVNFSNTEISRLRKVYQVADSNHPLIVAGNDRDMFRAVSHDGARLVAFLSRYLSPGEDPVKFVATVCADAGLEVSGEILEWADPSLTEEEAVGILHETAAALCEGES